MNKAASRQVEHVRYQCQTVKNMQSQIPPKDEILQGLLSNPRWISCKYFYDAKGSNLFDQICDAPEYYPTRTEAALLSQSAANIIECSKPDNIIELGSGTSRKTRHILDACQHQIIRPSYWPFDVCEPIIDEASEQLIDEYPWLLINGLVGDYMAGLDYFPQIAGRNLYIYIGGTIGNFNEQQAIAFLAELTTIMKPSDLLLIGFDRVKNVDVLNAAYNDAQGLTAEFNLNVLDVVNQFLGSNFDRKRFDHLAFYNEGEEQIEMHLVANKAMQVDLNGAADDLVFNPGDKIFTEISRKFTEQSIDKLLTTSGFAVEKHFEAEDQYFSLVLCKPVSS